MTAGYANADGTDPLIGKLVQGRFQVEQRLAAGGMGVVYKAIQQPLGRPVAFKVLEVASGAVDDTFQQRFLLEASAAAKLAHPNTIVVHDYGKTDQGQYFIAMEYLDGGSLDDRLKAQGPLSPADAMHVGLQIASSLRDAHQQGLVHRDLKPGNVMFAPRGGDPLFVKVLDFGLVKMVGEGEANLGLTQSGVMMGSPRYMAPEQVRAQPCDARTDIYSFGAVMFHMLAGAPPFSAGSAFEAMQHHVYTPAPSLRYVWPECPASPELDQLVLRCLAKEPAERPQSMDEVFQILRAISGEQSGSQSGSSYLFGPSSGSVAVGESGERSDPALGRSGVASVAGSRRTIRYEPPSQPGPVSSSGLRAHGDPGAFSQPGTAPPPRKKGGGVLTVLLLGLVLVLVAGLVGAAALFLPLGLDEEAPVAAPSAEPEAAAAEGAPSAAPEAAVPEAAAPVAAAPEAAAPAEQPPARAAVEPLMLRTDPSGATVRRDGADLGDTPLPLVIPEGDRWTIEVAREGYETRTVIVAGGQPELLLHLTRRPGSAAPRAPRIVPQVRPLAPQPAPAPRRALPRSRVYAPDLDDPWADQRR